MFVFVENAGEIFVVSVKVQKTRVIEEQKIEFRFANYFQDGMVLQRGKPGSRVWGFGQINQQVDVDFNGLPLNTTVQGTVWMYDGRISSES